MSDFVIAFLVKNDEYLVYAKRLISSVRNFGGEFFNSKLWIMVPEQQISDFRQNDHFVNDPNLEIINFQVTDDALMFPFAAKIYAASEAERLAEKEGVNLVFIDTNSLVFNEPKPFSLDEGISLAYRPVDHTLIGTHFDHPLDDFWALNYRLCGTIPDNIFPMSPSADENVLRPYFNAGIMVVTPQKEILRQWCMNFDKNFLSEEMEQFYSRNNLYRVFIHQTIFTSTILSMCEREILYELPPTVNYSLFLHEDYPDATRIKQLNEIISARYETFTESDWINKIPRSTRIDNWLKDQINV